MASMNLAGPHRLTYDEIDAVVGGGKPGVFALGYIGDRNAFYVNYIGRSDTDVRSRLMDCIGSDAAFKFALTETAKSAFVRECELFHAFRPRANHMHPSRPAVSGWTCPRCSMLGR